MTRDGTTHGRSPGVRSAARARCRATGERGGILLFTAIILVALLAAAGLSVDVGSLTFQKRNLQAVADAAAMDARFALGSPTACVQATALAYQSATNNSFSYAAPNSMVVTLGTAAPNANDVETFTADPTPCGSSQASDTAVQVVVGAQIKYAFNPGSATPSATAIWTSTASAGVSVGSSLVSVSSQRSVLGPLLNGLFGVDLTAVGYQGLATSNVTLGQLLAAVPASGLSLNVGTVSQLLNAQLSYAQLVKLSATALSQDTTDPTASANATFLGGLVTAVGALNLAGTVSLGQLIHLADPGASAAADASLNVLGLITGVAELANGGHAAYVSLAGTGVTLPLPTGATLIGSTVQASVISPPVVAYGPVGTRAYTSQVAILVNESVSLPVSILGIGLLYVTLDVPLYLTAAAAMATIAAPITCGPPSIVPIAVSATTLGGYLADMSSQSPPTPISAVVLSATLSRSSPVLVASGQLSLTLASAVPQTLTFVNPPDPPPSQTTSGSAIAPNLNLNQLTLSGPGAFQLSPTALMALLAPVLNPVVDGIVGGLTTSVVQPLLDDLGAQAGIATVGNPPYPGTSSVACSGNIF